MNMKRANIMERFSNKIYEKVLVSVVSEPMATCKFSLEKCVY